jgi:hypothetical protein
VLHGADFNVMNAPLDKVGFSYGQERLEIGNQRA